MKLMPEAVAMTKKAFASSQDLTQKQETLDVLADGVYALTAEGDPNVGAIEADDFVVAFDARATPKAATDWLAELKKHTTKPVKYLVLSHYHAVRVLGASAFSAQAIISHDNTRRLIEERGLDDWESELRRMPRLFRQPDGIPGLTHPDIVFNDRLEIPLGSQRGDLVLEYCGLGHTSGDICAWLPEQKILFTGDLVEARAALYTGDAFHVHWSTTTLDKVKAYGAQTLVGGRGAVVHGHENVNAAIEQSRLFLNTMIDQVSTVFHGQGTLKEAFVATHDSLAPQFGGWPIFEHCLPFNVQRLWDELSGLELPRVWTAQRDQDVWDQLQD